MSGSHKLTEPEETVIIQKYSELEKTIKTSTDCAIGAGYTTCIDMGFRAKDFFEVFGKEIRKLSSESPITPRVHSRIVDLRQFVETFLYYFSQGANAERVSVSSCKC